MYVPAVLVCMRTSECMHWRHIFLLPSSLVCHGYMALRYTHDLQQLSAINAFRKLGTSQPVNLRSTPQHVTATSVLSMQAATTRSESRARDRVSTCHAITQRVNALSVHVRKKGSRTASHINGESTDEHSGCIPNVRSTMKQSSIVGIVRPRR